MTPLLRACTRSRRSLGALLAWAAALPAAAASVHVELLSSAAVSARTVTLGQIAHITSDDLSVIRRLVALPLGNAPEPDAPVSLDREALARWIRMRAGLAMRDIEWSGEDRVQIHRLHARVQPDLVTQVAQSALTGWLRERSERFELHAVTDPRVLRVAGDGSRLSVRPIAYDQPARRMQLWVEVWNGAELVRSIPVIFDVKTFANANDVEPRLAVRRGDMATLRVINGAISLERRVEVLQDAWLGQSVRVRAAPADSPVVARVSAPGLLELKP